VEGKFTHPHKSWNKSQATLITDNKDSERLVAELGVGNPQLREPNTWEKIIQHAIQKQLAKLPPSAKIVELKRVQGTQEWAGGIFQALDKKVAENQLHMTQGVAFALQKIESFKTDTSVTQVMNFPTPGPPGFIIFRIGETAQIFTIPPAFYVGDVWEICLCELEHRTRG